MIESTIGSTLSQFVHIGVPFLLIIAGGGLFAGLLQAVLQIEDRSIGLLMKIGALVLFLSVGAHGAFPEILAFTQKLWGSASYYH